MFKRDMSICSFCCWEQLRVNFENITNNALAQMNSTPLKRKPPKANSKSIHFNCVVLLEVMNYRSILLSELVIYDRVNYLSANRDVAKRRNIFFN